MLFKMFSVERVNAYLLGTGIFALILVGCIYLTSWFVGQRRIRLAQ